MILKSIKLFFLKILYLSGILKKEDKKKKPDQRADEPTNTGVNGRIESDILVLRDSDRVIISIDHDFMDVLGWVEWDVNDNRIDLVQKSGAVANLGSVIPAAEAAQFRKLNKVFVITRYNKEQIMHNLSLVIRE